ncbi:hypothetical protein ABPG75_009755 [Micractinium tetrahymenae]
MGRAKKRKAASEEAGEAPAAPALITDGGVTEMERERAALIARNRERLLALGIPSLVTELGGGKAAAAAAKKQQKKKAAEAWGKEGDEDWGPRPKRRRGGKAEQPTRRSRRLQEAEEHQKEEEEHEKERFGRELGKFAVEGECPRCGKVLEKGQRQHLQTCTGAKPKPKREPREPGARREDALSGLTEEERRDRHKVLLARMAQLHLDGLIEMTHENAKFVVLGSKGNHYTITLKDDKHTCGCLDYRFRRHNCKHILLVLSQLGIEDRPQEWRSAVGAKMDELLEQKREREAAEARAPPLPRAAAELVGMKFV